MADSQRKTANLLSPDMTFNASCGYINDANCFPYSFGGNRQTAFFYCKPSTKYTFSAVNPDRLFIYEYNETKTAEELAEYTPENPLAADRLIAWQNPIADNPAPFETSATAKMVSIYYSLNNVATDVMTNEGQTALPYEPYWQHSLRKLTTATEAVENPLYSDGTAITAYTINGNTVQNGTPTPSNPVDVNGVGELETSGEHAGEYKIPISSGGVTTNIYLGSTQTVRQIKKLTFTGNEDWQVSSAWKKTNTSVFFYNQTDMENTVNNSKIYVLSDKFEATSRDGLYNGDSDMIAKTGSYAMTIRVSDSIATTAQAFKTWLASNPVTVWYVLATPETGAVNEPLMKIGTYADTLSNAVSIPTTEGANSITVDTTVQPSEFTATWTGWHDASVKEYDGTDWT